MIALALTAPEIQEVIRLVLIVLSLAGAFLSALYCIALILEHYETHRQARLDEADRTDRVLRFQIRLAADEARARQVVGVVRIPVPMRRRS